MGKSILCPYCFNDFDNTKVMVQCENYSTRTVDGQPVEICESEENYLFNTHWGETVMSKHVFKPKIGLMDKIRGYQPKACKCDKCGANSTRFVCPHCNNWLPTEMIEKGAEIISVIGGPASGKSNYIVSLIQQLNTHGTKIKIGRATPQEVGRNKSEQTRILYGNARKSIFENHTPVAKTNVSRKPPIPWIFRLESLATDKAVYLVFYDTAGENFKGYEEIKRNAEYLKKSKAVIVLLDTLSIPHIQKIMSRKKIINQDIATPISETLDTLLNFKTGDKQVGEHLLKSPFAFVMSKFDTVIDNKEDLEFDISAFKSNSSFIKTGKLSLKEIDEASDTIINYIKEHCEDDGSYIDTIQNNWKDNARFFGASALGAMTNKENMKIDIPEDDKVKPFRVMDPLIWILHKIGGFGIPVE